MDDDRKAKRAEQARKRYADPEWRAKYLEYQRQYREANREKVRQQKRDWMRNVRGYPKRLPVSDEERHQRRLEWERAYRAKNLQRLRAYQREWTKRNPDKNLAKTRKYAATERGRQRVQAIARASQIKRRGRIAGAEGCASKEQVLARIAYFGWRCWMCGGEWEAVDHVKPLAAGGSNWPANLRPACTSCNSSKGARRI